MSNAATNGRVIELAPYLARPNLADGLNREELASLIGQLEELKARCWARLMSPVASEAKTEPVTATRPDGDRYLTTAEAAAILRRKPSWIYRHAAHLPFVVKRDSPREPLRCSERGIQRYLARR
jgi:hypothetical protein